MTFSKVTLRNLQAPQRWALNGGPFGSKLVQRDYVASGVPVIRGGNLSTDGKFNANEFVFVTPKKADELLPNNALPGDLVFTQRGTLGQVGIVPNTLPFPRYVISQSQMKLAVDRQKADSTYIYYVFRSSETVQRIHNQAFSSGVPHINLEILRDFEISLPELPVQHRISSILSAYDDLIENNTRRIKILEDMAQMLYREWFVNFRFPGYENVKMVESEIGPIPEGWALKRLEEVAKVNELSIKSSSAPGRIRYIDIASVSTARIEKIDSLNFADAPGRARRIVRHGDVIWSTVRPNRCSYALILTPEPNLIVSTGFAVLTAKTIPFSYLYLTVTTDDFADYLTNHATGSAYPAVTGKEFEKANLIVPNESLRNRFHEIAEPMLNLSWCLHQRNANLRTTRDFLLPKLISGEVSVEAADEAAAELVEQPA